MNTRYTWKTRNSAIEEVSSYILREWRNENVDVKALATSSFYRHAKPYVTETGKPYNVKRAVKRLIDDAARQLETTLY